MGIAKKTDGRYVVGMGVTDANDYKGSASYRDIFIQLTADGATEESVEYLTYLKDYAIYANSQGEPIMPPSVNVWISNNGVTTAVEADDLALDGDNFTICGIKWDGSSWDFSDVGKGGGGGSAGTGFTIAGFFDASTAPEVPEGKSILNNSYKCEAWYDDEKVECIYIDDPEMLPVYVVQNYGPVLYYRAFTSVGIGDVFTLEPLSSGPSLTDVVLTVKSTATCYGQVTTKEGLDEVEYYLVSKNDVEWVPAPASNG